VYRYENAPHVLSRFLVKRLSQDVALFKAIMNGEVSKGNYLEYSAKNKVAVHVVRDALLLFGEVTLESLYAKLILYQSLQSGTCVEFLLKGCRK
jgi:hypothetical protein